MNLGPGWLLGAMALLALAPVGFVLVETASRFFWFNRVRDALGRIPGLDGGAWDGAAYVYSGRPGGRSVRIRLMDDRLLATVGFNRFRLPGGLELHVDEGSAWHAGGTRTPRPLVSGDPDFDAAWRMVARRPLVVPDIDAGVRALLLALRQPGLVLTEDTAAVMSRIPGDRRRAEKAVERLLALAAALDGRVDARAAG